MNRPEMNRPARNLRTWVMALLIAAGWLVLVPVQMALDRQLAPYRAAPDLLWIPSGKIIRTLSLGHNGLLANLYWTRVVQYFGTQRHERKMEFPLLAPLLDITVALDPYLLVAYKFGAVFLSAKPPYGAGQPEKAVDLLQRGIQANPDEWRLWHDLGFIYYWDLKDYKTAAAAYREGSKNPSAQPWMRVMAAVIAEKGETRETSRFLWTEIYRSTEDEAIRNNARMHLETLRVLDDIEELEKRAAQFRERAGRWPQSFDEMVSQGLLGGVPEDPQGHPYQLQPGGKIILHPKSEVKLDYAPPPEAL